MKPFGKTKDGVIDSLLRAYVSRSGNPSQACPEFDPDLANAYIELRLPSGSRTRYEQHLSECGACRKNVVALVRLADPPALVSPARDRDRATWLSGARKVFGAMSRPQWAMATAAALVLAISLPVLMSRERNKPNQKVAEAINGDQQRADNGQGTSQPSVVAPVASSRSASADSSTPATAALRKRESETEATGSSGAARNAGASVVVGALEQTQKSDAKSASPTAEESQRKSQSELASQAPAQAGAAASQVAKNDSDETRKQRQEKDAAQQPPESKPGRVDEPRDKEKPAKAEEVAQPPAPAASSEVARSRGGLRRSPPKLGLRASAGAGESVRSNEKRINKKDFFFRDNTWTDKDFDPNKNLPVVTIIRDSNVYKELLAKRAGLKPYLLDGFSENERAIIVFKGTVYKLIPQK